VSGPLATQPPCNVWDLLDAAFALYRERFLHFAALAAVLYLPPQVVNIWLSGELHTWFLAQKAGADSSTESFLQVGDSLAQTAVLQVPLALSVIFLGAGVSESLWAQLQGTELTTADVLKRVLRKSPKYALIGLFTGVSSLVAVAFFGIGHWLTATWFLTLPATLQLERLPLGQALGLIRRRQRSPLWWRSLGLLFLTEAVSGLLLLGITLLVMGILYLIPTNLTGDNKDLREFMLTSAANSLCRYLIAPVGALAASLLYVDLRIRREALDLVTEAQEQGVPLQP